MSICKTLLKESCRDGCINDCVCYKHGASKIDATMKKYLRKRKYTTFSDPEFKKIAGDVLLEFLNFFKNDAILWPMFGTLLGLVREGDIISHDEDIDLGFFKDDEDKLINILDTIHNINGFVVIRNQFKSIYTVWKNDVFIDLYLYKVTNTEQLEQGHRHFYNILTTEAFPFKKINFRNTELDCIAKPEAFLERFYGKDWTTPK
jgi:phosphorylcholine metabolism protein LicD